MVHLSQKPSFNRGNQNTPKYNPPTAIAGTIKTVCSISESHDDQSGKRSKALLLPPMRNQKWEAGWTLPSTAWTRTQRAWAASPAATNIPWSRPAPKSEGNPERWRRSSCTHSHYPPPTPPTPDTPGSGYSQQPKLPRVHEKSPVLGYSTTLLHDDDDDDDDDDTPCAQCWNSPPSPKSRNSSHGHGYHRQLHHPDYY